ncbi:hypothetical protein PPERSA_08476 [Pseudocohnilembus persalinus]|uniref:Uncharacterized protein n=1 Tax=Pseudocohnilembus persalinus TaxID=266149 RepID=A0A0V0R6G2_PSEPJ|nr:hypothetical protein PPERSA_08476 [Pseudocohnilembus persalinus]|eukprot:KRX10073.1 hypothetical protein PPERSA_08476 [Pseudocohnilembus persalinus]
MAAKNKNNNNNKIFNEIPNNQNIYNLLVPADLYNSVQKKVQEQKDKLSQQLNNEDPLKLIQTLQNVNQENNKLIQSQEQVINQLKEKIQQLNDEKRQMGAKENLLYDRPQDSNISLISPTQDLNQYFNTINNKIEEEQNQINNTISNLMNQNPKKDNNKKKIQKIFSVKNQGDNEKEFIFPNLSVTKLPNGQQISVNKNTENTQNIQQDQENDAKNLNHFTNINIPNFTSSQKGQISTVKRSLNRPLVGNKNSFSNKFIQDQQNDNKQQQPQQNSNNVNNYSKRPHYEDIIRLRSKTSVSIQPQSNNQGKNQKQNLNNSNKNGQNNNNQFIQINQPQLRQKPMVLNKNLIDDISLPLRNPKSLQNSENIYSLQQKQNNIVSNSNKKNLIKNNNSTKKDSRTKSVSNPAAVKIPTQTEYYNMINSKQHTKNTDTAYYEEIVISQQNSLQKQARLEKLQKNQQALNQFFNKQKNLNIRNTQNLSKFENSFANNNDPLNTSIQQNSVNHNNNPNYHYNNTGNSKNLPYLFQQNFSIQANDLDNSVQKESNQIKQKQRQSLSLHQVQQSQKQNLKQQQKENLLNQQNLDKKKQSTSNYDSQHIQKQISQQKKEFSAQDFMDIFANNDDQTSIYEKTDFYNRNTFLQNKFQSIKLKDLQSQEYQQNTLKQQIFQSTNNHSNTNNQNSSINQFYNMHKQQPILPNLDQNNNASKYNTDVQYQQSHHSKQEQLQLSSQKYRSGKQVQSSLSSYKTGGNNINQNINIYKIKNPVSPLKRSQNYDKVDQDFFKEEIKKKSFSLHLNSELNKSINKNKNNNNNNMIKYSINQLIQEQQGIQNNNNQINNNENDDNLKNTYINYDLKLARQKQQESMNNSLNEIQEEDNNDSNLDISQQLLSSNSKKKVYNKKQIDQN